MRDILQYLEMKTQSFEDFGANDKLRSADVVLTAARVRVYEWANDIAQTSKLPHLKGRC